MPHLSRTCGVPSASSCHAADSAPTGAVRMLNGGWVKAMPPTALASYAIAIGASDGGISALAAVLRQLPPQLNATVFIVQHLSPGYDSVLSSILQRASAWPCIQARDGELF